eukprot:2696569-Amphidinium_carterae.2
MKGDHGIKTQPPGPRPQEQKSSCESPVFCVYLLGSRSFSAPFLSDKHQKSPTGCRRSSWVTHPSGLKGCSAATEAYGVCWGLLVAVALIH